jgi:hypothetical protein
MGTTLAHSCKLRDQVQYVFLQHKEKLSGGRLTHLFPAQFAGEHYVMHGIGMKNIRLIHKAELENPVVVPVVSLLLLSKTLFVYHSN